MDGLWVFMSVLPVLWKESFTGRSLTNGSDVQQTQSLSVRTSGRGFEPL